MNVLEFNGENKSILSEIVASGGIAVIPTDTVYGIVASATDERAIEKLYAIRQRDAGKPCIILLSKTSDIFRFGAEVSSAKAHFLDTLWPGPTSVLLKVRRSENRYLDRGATSLAFRVPADQLLQDFLLSTGPLIAPSANLQGMPVAQNILQAQDYFGNSVDIYADGGRRGTEPSTLIRLESGGMMLLREGLTERTQIEDKACQSGILVFNDATH